MFIRRLLETSLPVLLLHQTWAQDTQYAVATIDGQLMRVRDDRKPSLYTSDFGDCLGKSAINVTRFDAAYYKDNMTITFHLTGQSALRNESIMMNMGVFAYGESRFDLTFDPCSANIHSACPVQPGSAIEAEGIIPINEKDVAGIPTIALSIPDFEGQAILRIFSNSSRNEIGCYAAQITNGNTFYQPAFVGSILGVATFLAMIGSFAAATCGADTSTDARKHYAHSFSVSILFSVWHHIYYSGALSLNWPSVLVAFWGNFAWTGGMIYSESMQNTINNFIGSNKGNTSHVGAAGTGAANPNLGGGVDLQQIYGRRAVTDLPDLQGQIGKRHLIDATDGFRYYGQPVKPGLPLPGNYSGFAGTLARQKIPASNSFITGFFWFLITVTAIVVTMVMLKLVLESLSHVHWIRRDRMSLFRTNYIAFVRAALLRSLFTGFFMMAFLAMFQFSYLAVAGPVAIACVVFVIIVIGIGSAAAYVFCSNTDLEPATIILSKRRIPRGLPWMRATNTGPGQETSEGESEAYSFRWWRLASIDPEKSIHTDDRSIRMFGWLAARYRRTRWWVFVVWIFYEFIRACFLAGATEHSLIQVLGLLVVEIIAFLTMVTLRPFEGQRLNVIAVYLLGASKIITLALSVAFNQRFRMARIPATVIGVVIIVLHSLLSILIIVAVIVGLATSYMSATRGYDKMRPRSWTPWRTSYLERIDFEAQDIPRPQPMPVVVRERPSVPEGPSFEVKQVKRLAKVEDEDIELIQESCHGCSYSRSSPRILEPFEDDVWTSPDGHDRAASGRSRAPTSGLPRAARLHRGSRSSTDYANIPRQGRFRAVSNTISIVEVEEVQHSPITLT